MLHQRNFIDKSHDETCTVNSLYNAEVGVHICERLIEKTPYKSNVL